MTAEELLERCAAGEIIFIEVDLSGVDLSGAILPEIKFAGATCKIPISLKLIYSVEVSLVPISVVLI
jgi:hypothetical protein